MSPLRSILPVAVLAASTLMTAPASAGLLDGLLGGSKAEPDRADSRRRLWPIRDFSSVQLVARESNSAPNQHPAKLNPETLRRQLATVRFASGNATRPLFTADETEDLVDPLVQAFANAGPGDDVLLLSSARRSDAILMRPMAVTARLFVQGGQLQMIVHDARFDFYNDYVGSKKDPVFTYGSRTGAAAVTLSADAAASVRGDWLVLPLTAPAVNAATLPPAAAPAAPATAPAAPVAPAAAATPLRPRDPGFADEVEQRLVTLKRLRDKGLISEEEYQQKRREILQAL